MKLKILSYLDPFVDGRGRSGKSLVAREAATGVLHAAAEVQLQLLDERLQNDKRVTVRAGNTAWPAHCIADDQTANNA